MLGGLLSLLEFSEKSQHTVWNDSVMSGESLKTKTMTFCFQDLEDESLITSQMRLVGPLVVEAPGSSVRALGLSIRRDLEEGVHLGRGQFYFLLFIFEDKGYLV